MAMLATTDVIADMNTLATSDIVSDLNTLATSEDASILKLLTFTMTQRHIQLHTLMKMER